MNKKYLKTISEIYSKGENVIDYLNAGSKSKKKSTESIMISYDLQSGSYIKIDKETPDFNQKYTHAIASVVNNLDTKCQSILEVGVGEATVLANLIPKLKNKPDAVYGFDLSWSRVRYAIEYAKRKGLQNCFLFAADMFKIPIADNSIDVVYTSHSVEPNGGREKDSLLELMRITRKYLVLLEPAYEFASQKAKIRMNRYGYIKNLYATSISLGLNVIKHELFGISFIELNPTGIIVIKKEKIRSKPIVDPIVCPITKTPLKLIKGSYFTKKGLLAYPIIDGVPCFLEDNAIIATHFMDDFTKKL